MDKGILSATKTLVESTCHYIRDPSGVFSVCHARKWHIDKFPLFYCCFNNGFYVLVARTISHSFAALTRCSCGTRT